MKRKKTIYPILKEFNPLFRWHECKVCGEEFKREKGLIIIWENGRNFKCCFSCREVFKKIYENKDSKENLDWLKFLTRLP